MGRSRQERNSASYGPSLHGHQSAPGRWRGQATNPCHQPLPRVNEGPSGGQLNVPEAATKSPLRRVGIPSMETTQQGAGWVKTAAKDTLQTVLSHPRASGTDQPRSQWGSERPPGTETCRTSQLRDSGALLCSDPQLPGGLWPDSPYGWGACLLRDRGTSPASGSELWGWASLIRAQVTSYRDHLHQRRCHCGNPGRHSPGEKPPCSSIARTPARWVQELSGSPGCVITHTGPSALC